MVMTVASPKTRVHQHVKLHQGIPPRFETTKRTQQIQMKERTSKRTYHKDSKREDRTVITTTAYGGPRQVSIRPTNPTNALACYKGSDFNSKLIIYSRSNITTGTPLTNRKPTTTDGMKTTEKQWKVQSKTKFDTGYNINRRRRHVTKAKIISSLPDGELRNIQKVDKGKGNNTPFVGRKNKKNVTERKGGRQRRRAEEEGLKP